MLRPHEVTKALAVAALVLLEFHQAAVLDFLRANPRATPAAD